MGYTIAGLKDKILALHPEIAQHGIVPSLTFDADKKAYVLTLTKGAHKLSTYIDKPDASRCMDGHVCVGLALQVAQFIANFQEGE